MFVHNKLLVKLYSKLYTRFYAGTLNELTIFFSSLLQANYAKIIFGLTFATQQYICHLCATPFKIATKRFSQFWLVLFSKMPKLSEWNIVCAVSTEETSLFCLSVYLQIHNVRSGIPFFGCGNPNKNFTLKRLKTRFTFKYQINRWITFCFKIAAQFN